MPSAFEPVQTTDRTLLDLQTSIEKAWQSVKECPLVDGRLVESVSVSNIPQELAHGLGRKWRGVIVVRNDSAQPVIVIASSLDDTKYVRVYLGSVTTATISLWVF